MRICSLLPSLTETLFALGAGDQVVGVTHECDFPPEAHKLPHLTRSKILTAGVASSEIDRQVKARDGSLYELDADALRDLKPDLILTQRLCDVCAVSEPLVRDVAATLPGNPRVESFAPTCVAEVFDVFMTIGALVGRDHEAHELMDSFARVRAEIRSRTAGRQPRRTCVLEWLDPPFAAGHWTPELTAWAGGRDPLGRPSQPSREVQWKDVIAADPEVLVLAPCGMELDRTLADVPLLDAVPGWHSLTAVRHAEVYATDGSAYFNRPGPRLLETLAILAAAIHPDACADLAPAGTLYRLPPNLRAASGQSNRRAD